MFVVTAGDADHSRFWQIWKESGGCETATGWMVITHDNFCNNSRWVPSEGQINPQIRYSINTSTGGIYLNGLMSDSSQNAIADTMVVYIDTENNSNTFGMTSLPTYNPTNNPSINPTKNPTSKYDLNIYSTSTPNIWLPETTGSETGVTASAIHRSKKAIYYWEFAASLVLCASCLVTMALLVGIMVYHEIIMDVEMDKPKYFTIVKFIHHIADFWTDLLMCVILYYQAVYLLFMCCLCFTIFPFLMQCVVSIYWIIKWKQWKQDNPGRLHEYLFNYEIFLYFSTVISGFYNTLDLVTSKIFYIKCFYFPLKSKEFQQLAKFRFVNIVLMENIPQIMIQLSYIFYFSEKNNISVIVFFSMVLSVLSLVFSFVTHMSRLCYYLYENQTKQQFRYVSDISGMVTVESKYLNKSHIFCHKRMQLLIKDVLDTCDDHHLWVNRSDVRYSLEVYFINDHICSMNQFDAYFTLNVHSATRSDVSNEIVQAIKSMSIPSGQHYKQFEKALLSGLHLKSIDYIGILSVGVVTTTMTDTQSVDLGSMQSDPNNNVNVGMKNEIIMRQIL